MKFHVQIPQTLATPALRSICVVDVIEQPRRTLCTVHRKVPPSAGGPISAPATGVHRSGVNWCGDVFLRIAQFSCIRRQIWWRVWLGGEGRTN